VKIKIIGMELYWGYQAMQHLAFIGSASKSASPHTVQCQNRRSGCSIIKREVMLMKRMAFRKDWIKSKKGGRNG